MMRFICVLTAVAFASGCVSAPSSSTDPEVLIRIANGRTEPLQCRMMFGHWVDSDLGPLVVGGVNGIAVRVQQQQQDGALYVMRDDGQRRMMIENILCASPDNWRATVGQIDLAAVRAARAKEVWVACVLPKAGGHVSCSPPYFKPQ